MARAKQILEEHAEGHHALANLLIEREVITSEDVERILGPRPWKSRGDEILSENPADSTQTPDTQAPTGDAGDTGDAGVSPAAECPGTQASSPAGIEQENI